jgi:hypothetical protein
LEGDVTGIPDGGGFKYAALLLRSPSGPKESRQFSAGKETLVTNIASLVPDSELAFWRGWLGTLAWEEVDEVRRVVLVRSPASSPTVLDGVDETLRGKASTSWRAFLLCEPHVNTEGPSWLLTGRAAAEEPGTPLLAVRSASRVDRIVRPFYATREKYWAVQRPLLRSRVEASRGPDVSWYGRWLEIDELLTSTPYSNLLGLALLAHGSARTRPELEFAIPELVRAAEGVLALERGMGAKMFGERALRIAPGLATDEYVGPEIGALLPELYQARSDCVHGKVPFLGLQALGPEGEDRAGQLAYVAEVLAREALVKALRFPDRSIFESRDQLELAWAGSAFPVPG